MGIEELKDLNRRQYMCANRKFNRQAGFSMMELLISMAVMTIITGAAFALIGGSIRFTNSTFHLTDAEQTLRTAHEIIHRDLTTAGNGLKGVGSIWVPRAFVANYLTLIPDASDPMNLALVVSDDNVPGTTVVAQSNPVRNVLDGSDRLTMLTQDTSFNNGNAVSLFAGQITMSGSNTNIVVGSANIGLFQVGEIYAIAAQNMAFGVVTSINTGTNTLIMSNGDVYGLNQTVGGPIYAVAGLASGPSTPASIVRMQIIHYYVNSNNLLIRRVFGIKLFNGAGFVDSVIAEHVTNLQFRYLLNKTDPNGFLTQPVRQVPPADREKVREVETTLAVETVRAVNVVTNSNSSSSICGVVSPNGKQTICSTTATTVRNLQFRKFLQ
jgi:prepilin-type N-terminal cleavage/methylation domain-containing protein